MTTTDADVRYSRGFPGLVPWGIKVGVGWGPDYEVPVLPLRLDLVAEHVAAMTGIAAADLRFEDVRTLRQPLPPTLRCPSQPYLSR